ncbi:hypothetical protein CMI47_18245 [Candidatus Pacearchaeota archaeon]|jgi:hypothetical protein|nr:hypothetical protein [Candidatus Pacearchaeota archaeon]|tara:strand:+ start:19056 stop:19943 length:888 start_codon:yes stop_codon:yes gene_type:complete
MTFIIAIGGKKGSGKTSLSMYLAATMDCMIFNQNHVGELFQKEETQKMVYDNRGEYVFRGIEGDVSKTYSFADDLKNFLHESFGIKDAQLYGSDDEKNSLTKYVWETLPAFVRWTNSPDRSLYRCFDPDHIEGGSRELINSITNDQEFFDAMSDGWIPSSLREGRLTARELMQVIGTDVGRKMFHSNIWVDSTINRIKRDKPKIAMIDDLRFCTEAEAVVSNGGIVILLSRNNESTDTHGSEKDLENLTINSDRIISIDNNCDINDKNKQCLDIIQSVIKNELMENIKYDFSQQI